MNRISGFFACLLVLFSMVAVPAAATLRAETNDERTTESLSYGYPARFSVMQLGVVSYYQLFDEQTPIKGLRLGFLSNWSNDTAGVSLAPLYNWGRRTRGLEIAGITNVLEKGSEGPSSGVTLAGIVNTSERPYHGLRLAGICNIGGALKGVELGGLWNYAKGFSGIQGALLMNKADAMGAGLQVSALYNTGEESSPDSHSTRAQIAVCANHLDGSTAGVMVSGFYNEVNGKLRGVQVGGFNKAESTRGIQFGIINDAKELHGVQIGLFNFSERRLRLPLINVRF
ncbi:hypothetical protein GC173_00210 [bacterium]|nr:hypothetical protein [bacterium]